jgi:hypothetical protein
LEAVKRRVAALKKAVGVLASGGSTEDLRQAILAWADVEERASDYLSEIQPPEDAEAANRNLVDAEQEFADALRDASGALE